MVRELRKCVVCKKNIRADKGKKGTLLTYETQLCEKCSIETFPFGKLSENEFQLLNKFGISNITDEELQINLLSPTQNAQLKAINDLVQNTSTGIYDEEIASTLNCRKHKKLY